MILSKQKNRFHTERSLKNKKKRYYIKIGLIVLLFISILTGLSFWSGHHSMQIMTVEVSGTNRIDNTEIQNIVFENIKGKRFFIFSGSNTFLIKDRKIQKIITDSHHSIYKTKIKHDGLHTLSVEISEHEPVALWCRELGGPEIIPVPQEESGETADDSGADGESFATNGDEATNETEKTESEPSPEQALELNIATNQRSIVWNDCFYLNKKGVVFSEQEPGDTETYVQYAGNNSTTTEPIGLQYVDVDFFKHLQSLITRIKEDIAVNIVRVISHDGETYVLFSDDGQQIFVDLYDDLEEVLQNLETLFKQENFNEAQFENIQYIDMRFGNRVYYKLR